MWSKTLLLLFVDILDWYYKQVEMEVLAGYNKFNGRRFFGRMSTANLEQVQ
jgi:hypothetical protein